VSTHQRSVGYHVYILRFWPEAYAREPANIWRFSLEDPYTKVRRGFSTFNELIGFLENQLKERSMDQME
jgi:hypothetical protein